MDIPFEQEITHTQTPFVRHMPTFGWPIQTRILMIPVYGRQYSYWSSILFLESNHIC